MKKEKERRKNIRVERYSEKDRDMRGEREREIDREKQIIQRRETNYIEERNKLYTGEKKTRKR